MAKKYVKKRVVKAEAWGTPVHPAVDVTAVFMLVTPRLRVPVSLLSRGSKVWVEAVAKYRGIEVRSTRVVMGIGPRDYIEEMLSGVSLVASTEHDMDEELGRVMGEASRVMSVFPYMLVVLGQVVPHASLSIISTAQKDFLPGGYSVRLEPLIRVLGHTEYYVPKKIYDVGEKESVDDVEKIYMATVPSHDVTTVVLVASLPRIVEVLPTRVKEYVEVGLGGHGEKEE